MNRSVSNSFAEWVIDPDPRGFTLFIWVYGAYQVKENLKELGYQWNRKLKAWEFSRHSVSEETLEGEVDIHMVDLRLLGIRV